MKIKQKIKQGLSNFPVIWAAMWAIKAQAKRCWMLRYFIRDISAVYQNMFWQVRDKSHVQIVSELLFQYHKLEKGLVMPGPRRFFGEEPARAVVSLLKSWHSQGCSLADPVYLGALETLHAYAARLESDSLDKDDRIFSYLQEFLKNHPSRSPSLTTPRILDLVASNVGAHAQMFEELVHARRSVRTFIPKPVPQEMIMKAVGLAQQSPSACNRQPCRVYVVTEERKKSALLSLQNGNRGFGHLIPAVAVITADSGAFFDASERHEPYVDGGLFSMSLMYALSSLGLATCCLNWCASPENDDELRRIVPIARSEMVIMLMAIGFSEPEVLVPRSPRKSIEKVLVEV